MIPQSSTRAALLLVGSLVQAGAASADDVSDREETYARLVRRSVQAAAGFLSSKQRQTGCWPTSEHRDEEVGMTALATLALLRAGRTSDDPTVESALKYLRSTAPSTTYEVALMTLVLVAVDSPDDLRLIQKNVDWLQRAQVREGVSLGGWRYRLVSKDGHGDVSCSEMAIWALDEAEKNGATVAPNAWKNALEYWKTSQRDDGSWGYVPSDTSRSTGSQTCCGIVSISTCQRRTGSAATGDDGARSPEAERGLSWLQQHFAGHRNPRGKRPSFDFYYLMLLRRVGDLMSDKPFEHHAWYQSVSDYLLREQRDDGAWIGQRVEQDPIIATSFAVLFLAPPSG